MKLLKAKKMDLSRYVYKRGNLSVIENFKNIPFEIKRVYWIYDVPSGEKRGGHAFHKNEELVVAMSGSFDLFLSDGISEISYTLNRPDQGFLVPAEIWRELKNFSTNAQVLVLASSQYNPDDYIWDKSSLIK